MTGFHAPLRRLFLQRRGSVIKMPSIMATRRRDGNILKLYILATNDRQHQRHYYCHSAGIPRHGPRHENSLINLFRVFWAACEKKSSAFDLFLYNCQTWMPFNANWRTFSREPNRWVYMKLNCDCHLTEFSLWRHLTARLVLFSLCILCFCILVENERWICKNAINIVNLTDP